MTVTREFTVETRGIGKPDYSISGSVDVSVGVASAFRSGLDAEKPAVPMAGEIWLARDTKKLYVCHIAGSWSGFDASILIQGILTLYANLAGAGYQIKNIANPTAAQDAATKASVDGKVTTHEEKTTGVHGVGASTVCSEAEAADKITAHKGDTSAHHPRYINAEAQTTVKANVEVGDLKAPTKALAMNSQKITGLLAPTAPGDALRKGTVLTLTEIPTPLTGKDADTVDGAHKTDLEGTMDTKITTHETGGKHRWTLNKLRKGAGSEADPTEIDVPVIPSGLIAMWHGTIANIPSGWVICDGNSGTPNLLARFVQGVATAATNPGATGGATGKTTAGHYHGIPMGKGIGVVDIGNTYGSDPESEYATVRAEGASQTLTSVVKSSTKTDSISDIRPLFYDVAFIMKT